MTIAIENQTTNGGSDWQYWSGRQGLFAASGTFDGANVDVEISFDGGATSFVAATIQSKGISRVDIPRGPDVRIVVKNAGASTDITARV